MTAPTPPAATTFTVVVPTYNRVQLLLRTLESVRQQTFPALEVLVVDDSSTDGTAEEVERLGPPFRVIRPTEKLRVSAARNAGIKEASGDYIAFLDDDDLMFPWTLETYRGVIERHPGVSVITSNGMSFSEEAEWAAQARGPLDARYFADYLAYANNPEQPGWLIPTGVVMRADVARLGGGFDPALVYYEDEDMWLRTGVAPGYVRVASPLCWGYRSHPLSISHKLYLRFGFMQRVLEKEKRGEYPGGEERRRERQEAITHLARHLARRAAREGFAREGWSLYRRIFPWNVACRRWKFLGMYPLEALGAPLARRFRGRPASAPAP